VVGRFGPLDENVAVLIIMLLSLLYLTHREAGQV
jgi:hypothetical protein